MLSREILTKELLEPLTHEFKIKALQELNKAQLKRHSRITICEMNYIYLDMQSDIFAIFLEKFPEVHIEWFKHQTQMLLVSEVPVQSQAVKPNNNKIYLPLKLDD